MAYYNKYQYQNKSNESEYNSATYQILRLNLSWARCNNFWREGKLQELNHELELIWDEFWADAIDPEKEKYERINKKVLFLFGIFKKSKDRESYLRSRSELSDKLKEKKRFLKEVEKRQGLGKKYKDDDDDAF